MTKYSKWGFFHCQFPLQDVVLDSNFLVPLNKELEGMLYKLACSAKQSPSPAIHHNLQIRKHDTSSSSNWYHKDIGDMVLNIHMISNKKTWYVWVKLNNKKGTHLLIWHARFTIGFHGFFGLQHTTKLSSNLWYVTIAFQWIHRTQPVNASWIHILGRQP